MKKEILNTGEIHNHYTQIIRIGAVIINTLKSKKMPNGDFLPTNATDLQGKHLWDFRSEEFNGFGKLLEFKGEYYIYLEDRQRVIHKVIPVADLPKLQRVMLGDQALTLGGRDAYELYTLKVTIAEFLCATFVVTEQEHNLISAMAKIHQEELEKERLQKQEEREANERAKNQRIANIMAREKITAYTEDGKKRFGLPVINSEWEMLPDNTAVVVVNNLEEKIPVEAFFVKKTSNSGRTSKGYLVKVFAEKIAVQKNTPTPNIKASRVIRVLIDGRLTSVVNFSKENFDLLRKTGLNSGTMVSIGEPNANGKYTVVQLKGNECLTVGEFATI